MNVLSRLGEKLGLKRKPQTLESKIASLESMPSDKLVQIAKADELQDLRVAAIEKLAYGKSLIELAVNDPVARITKAAKKRIAQLLAESTVTAQQLEQEVSDKTVLFEIAAFGHFPELQAAVLEKIDDEKLICDLAITGETSKIRQHAAQRIEGLDSLQYLSKAAKGKDKAVYRIVKDKLDAHKAELKAEEDAKAELLQLCEKIETHANKTFDNQYAGRAQRLLEQWKAVEATAIEEVQKRAWAALGRCQEKIQAVEDAENAVEEQKALVESTNEDRNQVLGEVRKLIASLYQTDGKNANLQEATQGALAVLRSSWEMLEEQGAASNSDIKAFADLCGAVEALQEAVSEHGSLGELTNAMLATEEVEAEEDAADASTTSSTTPKAARRILGDMLRATRWLSDKETPELVLNAKAQIQTWDAEQKQRREQQDKLVAEIGGLIRKAKGAIQSGRLRQASGVWRSIQEQIEASTVAQPERLTRQLEQLEEELNKLRDWHSYAVKPKKEALIEQAEALIGANITPDVLADRIKALQAEWKSLSKGGHKQHEELWTVFNEYTQRAYEPCKLYFQQQAVLRKDNLEKRKGLVKQLNDYCQAQDWEAADWKTVAKIVQVARDEWFSYSPTNRADTKPVQVEFDAVLEQLHGKLDGEYKTNIKEKEILVDRASKLAELEDTRDAIEQVKSLQVEWKQVGITPRKPDQTLWKSFRAHCDAVFEKREQESNSFKEQLQENAAKAAAHCEGIEDILKLSGKSLKDSRSVVEELQQAFNEVGILPKAQSKKIQERFNQGIANYQQKLADERSSEVLASWQDYFAIADQLRGLALAQAGGADISGKSGGLREHINALSLWPISSASEILANVDNIVNPNGLASSESELLDQDAIRRLCIQAEILSSQDTPDEDRALRMELQVERLQQGLGQSRDVEKSELQSIVIKWMNVGAVSDDAYRPLADRLLACVKQLLL